MRTPAARPPRDRESGFSILVALAVTLLLGTLAMATALRMQDLARDGNRDRASLAAFHAAGGGVAAARAALARDPAWKGGTIPVGRAAARVAVAADLSDPLPPPGRRPRRGAGPGSGVRRGPPPRGGDPPPAGGGPPGDPLLERVTGDGLRFLGSRPPGAENRETEARPPPLRAVTQEAAGTAPPSGSSAFSTSTVPPVGSGRRSKPRRRSTASMRGLSGVVVATTRR